MNEQIKQLTQQALDECRTHDIKMIHAQAMDKYGIVEIPQCFSERFAELIVKECIEQIISKGTDWVDFAPSQTGIRPEYWNMAQQIKQHFGVEE
jgi:hypothetical protein